jgi:hydroxycarboxylate dehydrogenase B
MVEYVRLSAPALTEVGARIFQAAGGEREEALEIAGNLVAANLAGHDSHGIFRIPRYVEWVKRGYLNFGRHISVATENAVMATLDGHDGFGQVLGRQAVEFGLKKAKPAGLSLVALRHGGHLGRIGAWAELAAEAGYVSIHFVNVANSTLVAPYGGRERRMSTAPVAIGVPNGTDDHFILDFSTARSAEGKIMVAFTSGTPVPEGYVIDADGNFTTDPHALYGPVAAGESPNPRAGPGALVAMGDHKGSGLALACELLAGALTGSGIRGGNRPWNGMLSIYIDPERIDSAQDFPAAVADYIDYVRACNPRVGGPNVMVPGDPERRCRKDRLANGIPLAVDGWNDILKVGETLGVKQDVIRDILAGSPAASPS